MSQPKPLLIAVLVSGSGTNLQAIIDAIDSGALNARIELVVSSNSEAYGLVRAQQAGIECLAFKREDYQNPQEVDARIAAALQQRGVEYVVMAGYMRKVTEPLLKAFPQRIINLHPALLPSFPGAHAIQEAWDAGVKVSGITIHIADENYDQGPIIAQQAVVIEDGDTLESFEAKIHAAEHALYPQVLQQLAKAQHSLIACY